METARLPGNCPVGPGASSAPERWVLRRDRLWFRNWAGRCDAPPHRWRQCRCPAGTTFELLRQNGLPVWGRREGGLERAGWLCLDHEYLLPVFRTRLPEKIEQTVLPIERFPGDVLPRIVLLCLFECEPQEENPVQIALFFSKNHLLFVYYNCFYRQKQLNPVLFLGLIFFFRQISTLEKQKSPQHFAAGTPEFDFIFRNIR